MSCTAKQCQPYGNEPFAHAPVTPARWAVCSPGVLTKVTALDKARQGQPGCGSHKPDTKPGPGPEARTRVIISPKQRLWLPLLLHERYKERGPTAQQACTVLCPLNTQHLQLCSPAAPKLAAAAHDSQAPVLGADFQNSTSKGLSQHGARRGLQTLGTCPPALSPHAPHPSPNASANQALPGGAGKRPSNALVELIWLLLVTEGHTPQTVCSKAGSGCSLWVPCLHPHVS